MLTRSPWFTSRFAPGFVHSIGLERCVSTGTYHCHIRVSSRVVLVAQSCPALCNLMDCSPPGSSVHGSLQARRLEWAAMPFSRGSSRPRDGTRITGRRGLYHERHLGSRAAERLFWTDLALLSNVCSCLWPSPGHAWVLRSLRPPGQASCT